VTDDIDAYLHAHYTAQKQLRRERMWRVAGYVLAGMVAGYVVGSGLWLVTGAW